MKSLRTIAACLGALFLCVPSSHGAPVPFPVTLFSIDQLVEEIRGAFRIKVEDLSKNYITMVSQNSVTYVTTHSVTCARHEISTGNSVSRMSFDARVESSSVTEVVHHEGCSGKPLLTEVIRTHGEKPSPHTWTQVLLGQRTLELKNNESQRDYQALDESQRPIVGFSTKRAGTQMLSQMSLFGNTALVIVAEPGEEVSRMTYILHKTDYDYLWNGSRRSAHITFNRNLFEVLVFKNGKTQYQINREVVSLNDFQNAFSSVIIKASAGAASEIYRMFVDEMPRTEFVGIGTKSGRLLNELREVFGFLVSGNVPVARARIQQYISNIETGLLVIKDNRPVTSN